MQAAKRSIDKFPEILTDHSSLRLSIKQMTSNTNSIMEADEPDNDLISLPSSRKFKVNRSSDRGGGAPVGLSCHLPAYPQPSILVPAAKSLQDPLIRHIDNKIKPRVAYFGSVEHFRKFKPSPVVMAHGQFSGVMKLFAFSSVIAQCP